MEDVTAQAYAGISGGSASKESARLMEANVRKIQTTASENGRYQAIIKPFFGGIQQWLMVYEVFPDVRLVGAPPSSIGKFGGDTDNWVWPRHTGDFSLFRIYAGKDNRPAPYSPENVPYTPKKFFPVSTSGIKEGDFTMVVGYPGRTMEYLPSQALELVLEVSNPKKIALRGKRLDIINAAMQASDLNRIRYAAKQADIANAWKKWKGEMLGMKKVNAVGMKKDREQQYRSYFEAKGPEGKPYLDALDALKMGYGQLQSILIPVQYQTEAVYANTVFGIVQLTAGLSKKDPKQPDPAKRLGQFKAQVKAIWKDCDPAIERQLFEATFKSYFSDIPTSQLAPEVLDLVRENMPGSPGFLETYFDQGHWFDSTQLWKLAKKAASGDSMAVKKNKTYVLVKALDAQYESRFLPEYQRITAILEPNQQIFLKGQMEREAGKTFYPDANQTFRIAFGQVSGFTPQDGVRYGWQTTTEGILEKADSELDFKLEPALKSRYKMQNQSPSGPVPVAFIASNHSTGGNSGSPVLNAKGELIGVNFDRVWEGTMSDYYFDARICRNITCDIRYILWVVNEVGQCPRLVQEMDLRQ
jgi:hypothetical protein